MFEDSLVESAGKIKTKTKYTTLLSLLLQFGLIGVMILIPLIYTEALPSQTLHTLLVAPPPPPPPPPPAPAAPPRTIKVVQTNIINGQLRAPVKVPTKIAMIKEDEAPPPVASTGGVQGGVQGGVAGGAMGGVIGGMIGSTAPPPPPQPKVAPPPPQRIRVSSGVAAGNLINRVNPTYPTMAKTARISGSVILQATISKSGVIENVHAVSGHPMLVPAAIDAVRQWRYRPYLLNGEPVEVETQITVNFTLGG